MKNTITITIEKMGSEIANVSSKTLNVLSFETIKEAKKEIKRMIKEDGYQRGYEIYNMDLRTELRTNF
tara:strand:- start:394 stop:597 length:204 start_codon:yes stop_codon:yes gene_type:complete